MICGSPISDPNESGASIGAGDDACRVASEKPWFLLHFGRRCRDDESVLCVPRGTAAVTAQTLDVPSSIPSLVVLYWYRRLQLWRSKVNRFKKYTLPTFRAITPPSQGPIKQYNKSSSSSKYRHFSMVDSIGIEWRMANKRSL